MDVLSSRTSERGRRTIQMIHMATASNAAMWMQVVDQFARQSWSLAHVSESAGATLSAVELTFRPRRDAARHSVFVAVLRCNSAQLEVVINTTLRVRVDSVAESERSIAFLGHRVSATWLQMDALGDVMPALGQRLSIKEG